ncbi:hypothetical protein D3C86_1772680 [compost metagenome]
MIAVENEPDRPVELVEPGGQLPERRIRLLQDSQVDVHRIGEVSDAAGLPGAMVRHRGDEDETALVFRQLFAGIDDPGGELLVGNVRPVAGRHMVEAIEHRQLGKTELRHGLVP